MKKGWSLILFIGLFTTISAQNLDIELLRDINLHRNRQLDPTFKFLSNSVTPLNVGIILYAVTDATLHKRDSIKRNRAIMIVGTQLVASIITTGLKYGINRERPGKTYADIEVLSEEGSPSFPSGHTSSSFALATSLSLIYPKWYVVVPSFAWATSVAYSRMDLGCHYPSDVLAGAIIGVGSGYLTLKLNNWLNHRK